MRWYLNCQLIPRPGGAWNQNVILHMRRLWKGARVAEGIAWRPSHCDEMIAMTIFGTSKNEKVLAFVTDRTATARRTSRGRQISTYGYKVRRLWWRRLWIVSARCTFLCLQLSIKILEIVPFQLKQYRTSCFHQVTHDTIKPEIVSWCKLWGTAELKTCLRSTIHKAKTSKWFKVSVVV